MSERRWRVRLGAAAEVDFANIVKWTAENFGAQQARAYRDTLVRAIASFQKARISSAANRATKSWPACDLSTSGGTAGGEATS